MPFKRQKTDDPLERVEQDSVRVLAFSALTASALLIVAVIVITLIALSFANHLNQTTAELSKANERIDQTVNQLTEAKLSTCAFYNLIGVLPVVASGAQRTSRLGVELVLDSRYPYAEQGCSPKLTPPSKELTQLAKEYGLSIKA